MGERISLKAEILRRLRNSKDYVSGQDICDSMGVSRTAVWKVIKQLENEGYDIEAVTNKGYRLLSYPEILSGSVRSWSQMNRQEEKGDVAEPGHLPQERAFHSVCFSDPIFHLTRLQC